KLELEMAAARGRETLGRCPKPPGAKLRRGARTTDNGGPHFDVEKHGKARTVCS
ncbi:hypothetical protein LY76DRAFT_513650, partial [Colletotrichum caudatum]